MTEPSLTSPADVADGRWKLDPANSSVEFHVRHFYGLMTVKGHFDRYEGTLDLSADPAVTLNVDAASLDTKRGRRDKHLRSEDFFDVEHHPQVRFVSESAVLQGDALKVHGRLHAAGKDVPLDLDASLREAEGELEIEAVTHADHRELGMMWSPLGILRAPSKLVVRGRLLRAQGQPFFKLDRQISEVVDRAPCPIRRERLAVHVATENSEDLQDE